ncbi:MAG: serine hydrolase [Bacteroidetes bacterium]|jgi:CubicO group peptidase (beta-lactamase class C family)|nr:serine hydrolase [Bacteroidota bacterium]
MKTIGFKSLLLLTGLLFSIQLAAQVTPEQINRLDSIYTKALSDWNVPGMGIAIVSSDSVLLAKGYGVTDITTRQATDANTLFALASNTKSFTTTALAILVDRGQLHWDDKVIEHLPWFAMYNPYVTSEMTVEDLLSHRSGLKTFSGDLIWYGSNYSRQEIIRKARYLKPVYGFREHFGYSNLMFITAGELIPAITGKSWDDFVKEELLDKLDMNRSTLHVSDLNSRDNTAQPHVYVDNEIRQILWLDWDNMGPAGSLISSANDMAKWLQMNLSNGIFRGDTLVSSRQIYELQNPRTNLAVSPGAKRMFPETNFKSYALGWSLMDYNGMKVVAHNGGYDGMISQTLFIPEADLGFVIMTNSLSSMYYPLMYHTLDELLHVAVKKNWNDNLLEIIKKNEEKSKENTAAWEAQRVLNTQPSLPKESYEGFYGSKIYDTVQIAQRNGELELQFGRSPLFTAILKHWHYDTYQIEFKAFPSLPKGYVSFDINRDAQITTMEIFVDNPDFDFTELDLKRLP